jgi:hypothetical protein
MEVFKLGVKTRTLQWQANIFPEYVLTGTKTCDPNPVSGCKILPAWMLHGTATGHGN